MRLQIGDPLPAFSLPFVSRRRCEHSSWPGKLLLVVFSANTCPVVKAYAGRLATLVARYSRPHGLPHPLTTGYRGPMATLAIYSNSARGAPQEAFKHTVARFREGGLNHLCLHDANQEVARAFGAETTPEFFLFTRQATLAYRGALDDHADEAKATRPYLREAVEALVAGSPPQITESEPHGSAIRWRGDETPG